MTTERDELTQDVIDGSKRMHVNTSYGIQEAIAEHLRQLGYRKPRVIETADELDNLPVGAVVLDGDGVSWQKDRSPRTGKTWWGANNYDLPTSLLVERLGPFTVLWEGGE